MAPLETTVAARVPCAWTMVWTTYKLHIAFSNYMYTRVQIQYIRVYTIKYTIIHVLYHDIAHAPILRTINVGRSSMSEAARGPPAAPRHAAVQLDPLMVPRRSLLSTSYVAFRLAQHGRPATPGRRIRIPHAAHSMMLGSFMIR